MAQTTSGELDERVLGRRWTVRLDAADRGSAAVRISCSRPSCIAQRLPSAAAGRAAAAAHLQAHLRAASGPRAEAYCACKAEDCHAHARPDRRGERPEPWRCGGAVVLAVLSDRAGRWWRAMECCSRCASATPGAKIVSTAAPAPAPVLSSGTRAADGRPSTMPASAQFSHSPSPSADAQRVPATRPAPARSRHRQKKIAQRVIPYNLRPVELRDELIELGDLFRAYQQRPEPDLALLADLHARKARAFATWADATGDTRLRLDGQRAEQAATAARLQHQQRTGEGMDADGPVVPRLLTGPAHWEHARSVLDHATANSPLPGPEARLLVVMLTLRTAHTGVGNLVGQDLTGLGLTDPEQLTEQLAECGWLSIPGTVGDLLASRPENPTPIAVPSLTPRPDTPSPFTFGKKLRPKLSGWAQRVVTDKKLRKLKASANTRLLALTLATRTSADGQLGPSGEGITLEPLTSWCAVDPVELRDLANQLTTADWLTDAAVTDTHLTGRLTERVLPLTCPLP
ncbi:hypothetical protein [Streptomyces sp. NPDC091212]|uniref:hypothetical protein n=1 Tax=Streptomyces sp. NPDC091212 TaxID=3155191 RepID=UPI003447B2D1